MTGIIAILPVFVKGRGICSQIYYEDETITDDRSCENFLKNLCDSKNISTKMMRKNVKVLIKSKRNLPRLIDQNNVFFPVAYKKSEFKELRRAFVNCNYVKEIQGNDVVLITGEKISTLNTEDTLNDNLLNANYLMYRLKYENLKSFIIGDDIGLKANVLQNTGQNFL